MVLVLCLSRSLPVGFELVTLSKFNSHFFFLFSFVLLRRKSRGRSTVHQHAEKVSIPLRLLLRMKLTAAFSTQHCNNIKFYSPVKQRCRIYCIGICEKRMTDFMCMEHTMWWTKWGLFCFSSTADCKRSNEVKFSLCTLSGLQLNFVHRTAFPLKSYCLCDQYLWQ